MHVLITGATGFIGKELLQYLSSVQESNHLSFSVLASHAINGYPCVIHKNYSFVAKDFVSAGIPHVDIVLHMGAFTPKSSKEGNDILGANSNIRNTCHLIQNLPNPIQRFIFCSTIDVYGGVDGILSENSESHPTSLYAWSKLYCEIMLKSWSTQMGVDLQILRIGHIYGNGEDAYQKLIPTVIRRLLAGSAPILTTSGKEMRAFLHVSDCAKMIARAVLKEHTQYPLINVVSGIQKSVHDIVDILCGFSDVPIYPIIQNENEGHSICFNNERVEKSLGREEMTLEEGLRMEYEYFKAQGS